VGDAPSNRHGDKRRAWESRIWRLAFLLTGSVENAARVVERVLLARQDLMTIDDPARIDRLVALHVTERSNRKRAGGKRLSLGAYINASSARKSLSARLAEAPDVALPDEARQLHNLALKLGQQPRLAWILADVEGVDLLWTAKAMDCSKSAAGMHLDAARTALTKALAETGDESASSAEQPEASEHLKHELEDGANALRRAMDKIDPGPYLEAVKSGVRERRAGRIAAAVMLIALITLAIKIAYDLVT
jgi:hypothetical protein